MALNADNVRSAVTGAVYYDGSNTAADPTGTSSSLADYDDLGYVGDDGVTLTMPDAGDATPIKAWQNGATVRTLQAPPDDTPTAQLTLIETKLEVIEMVFGVTVTQTATEGSFVINTNAARTNAKLVIDVVDGDELIRIFGPKAKVTSIGEIDLKNGSEIGYQVTLALEFDQTLNGQAKVWMTALKTLAGGGE
jgi:hypothetical protein